METKSLQLIPKYERYVEYTLGYLDKIPKTDRYNIGSCFKNVMFEMFENIMYLNKVGQALKLSYCNKIDAQVSIQRIYIRMSYKREYINKSQFEYAIQLLDEIGRMLGGYVKSLGVKME